MKKILTIIISCCIIIELCSCSRGDFLFKNSFIDTDDKTAAETFNKIICAVDNKSKSELKSLFSKKAVSLSESFDKSIDNLFDFYTGDNPKWKKDDCCPAVDEDIEYGKKRKKFTVWDYITTSEERYIFFVVFFSRDDFDKNNVGVYTLRVIKASDEDTEFYDMDKMTIPGIYVTKN